MPTFQGLDPETIRKLLEGQEDVLTPQIRKEQAYFRALPCPVCRNQATTSLIDGARPFSPGAILPNRVLVCTRCETEFDPYTGLVRKVISESV